MKTHILSALALGLGLTTTAQAHDIHRTASDHTHPGPVYTHSVSSHYDHHKAHSNYSNQRRHHYNYAYAPKTVTNTSTYYSRSYPKVSTYTYQTTPNTTIHHPPYAYSSCAGRCDSQTKRMTVSRKTGGNTYTYRAPSEYRAGSHYINTPRKVTNCNNNKTVTHVSPYRTHKLTTCTSFGCHY